MIFSIRYSYKIPGDLNWAKFEKLEHRVNKFHDDLKIIWKKSYPVQKKNGVIIQSFKTVSWKIVLIEVVSPNELEEADKVIVVNCPLESTTSKYNFCEIFWVVIFKEFVIEGERENIEPVFLTPSVNFVIHGRTLSRVSLGEFPSNRHHFFLNDYETENRKIFKICF